MKSAINSFDFQLSKLKTVQVKMAVPFMISNHTFWIDMDHSFNMSDQ